MNWWPIVCQNMPLDNLQDMPDMHGTRLLLHCHTTMTLRYAHAGERLTALEAIGEAAAGREAEREMQPAREMAQGTPQIEPASAAIMKDQDPVPSHEAVHETVQATVQAQELDRAVGEEVRDMSAMSLEDHEEEWRKLDAMDELTRERLPVRSNEAGMAREELQESSRERTKDQDFGMEM